MELTNEQKTEIHSLFKRLFTLAANSINRIRIEDHDKIVIINQEFLLFNKTDNTYQYVAINSDPNLALEALKLISRNKSFLEISIEKCIIEQKILQICKQLSELGIKSFGINSYFSYHTSFVRTVKINPNIDISEYGIVLQKLTEFYEECLSKQVQSDKINHDISVISKILDKYKC